MGMPQPLGPGAAPAFCLFCRRRNVIAWRPGPGAVCKKLDGRYGYAATPGPRGCSCLLPILPKAECNGLAAPNNQTSQLRKQGHKAKSKGRQNLARKQGQKATRTGNHSPRGQNERKTWPKGKAKKAKMKECKAQRKNLGPEPCEQNPGV